MSDQRAFATLGQYAELARRHAENTGRWAEFPELSRQIIDSGAYTALPSKPTAHDRCEDLETFKKHVYEIPVDAFHIAVSFDAGENVAFLPDYVRREVIGGVQLPFVYSPYIRTNFYYMYYVYAGSGTLRLETGDKQYPAGSLVLIAPHVLHGFHVCSEDSLVLAFYIFNTAFEQSFWHQLSNDDLLANFFRYSLYGGKTNGHMALSLKPTHQLLTLLQETFFEGQPFQDEYAPTIATSLLSAFFAEIMRGFGDTVNLIDGTDYLVDSNTNFPAMLRYMQQHFRTVTLSEIASTFHFSEAYVSRLFKQHLNQNFLAVLQDMKVERTRRYLEIGNESLDEIAEHVGYTSAAHLRRIFRRKYGLSPGAYRKEYRRKHDGEPL